jgi:hypothetical protein
MSELRDDTNVTFPPYPMQYALLTMYVYILPRIHNYFLRPMKYFYSFPFSYVFPFLITVLYEIQPNS